MQPIAGPIFRYNARDGRLRRLPRLLRRLVVDQQPRLQRRLLEGSQDPRRTTTRCCACTTGCRTTTPAAATTQQNSLVIGTQFGDDGALYMARYPGHLLPQQQPTRQPGADRQDLVRRLRGDDRADDDGDVRPGDARQRPDVHRPGHAELQRDRSGGCGPDDSALVDYIEHRVTLNGVPGDVGRGAATRDSRTRSRRSAPLSELGAYSVEYRAVDRGGNAEAIKTVTFWITGRRRCTGKVKRDVPSTLALSVNPLTLPARSCRA